MILSMNYSQGYMNVPIGLTPSESEENYLELITNLIYHETRYILWAYEPMSPGNKFSIKNAFEFTPTT